MASDAGRGGHRVPPRGGDGRAGSPRPPGRPPRSDARSGPVGQSTPRLVSPPPPLPGRLRGDTAETPAVGTVPPPAARRPGRTARQRLLLGTGAVGSVVVLLAACFVGWGALKLSAIDREELSLDLPTGSAKNYLVVGSDSRERGHPKRGVTAPIEDRRPLADTIMILRIDPASSEPLLLSLPRDLWVTRASDQQKGRINAAYGEGPQSLVDTLRDELGIPIHHYIEVDFKGFEGIVDAIGGVPMWFDREMRDFQSDLKIETTGCLVLDGYDALAFARSRHLQVREEGGTFEFDGTGDLGRISRQQFFIRRTIERVIDQAGSNPLTIKRLIESGTDNVTLDDTLTLTDLVRIGNKFSALDADDLATYTLPTTPRTTTGGAAVLEIDRQEAAPILARFRGPDDPDPLAAAAAVDRASVAVTVLNSSGAGGAAEAAAQALAAAGFGVERWGNGAELGHPTEARTELRFRPDQEAEAEAVSEALVAGADLIADPAVGDQGLILFLGADYGGVSATPEPTPTTSSTSVAGVTTTPGPAPTTSATPGSVSVVVLNSSGAPGAAATAAAALTDVGFTVPRTGNGSELGRPAEARTLVLHGAGGEAAAQQVAAHVVAGAEVAEVAELEPGAVVLFLGTDFVGVAPPATTTTAAPTTTTTTEAAGDAGPGSGSSSAATRPPSSELVGELPIGTPPPGETCG